MSYGRTKRAQQAAPLLLLSTCHGSSRFSKCQAGGCSGDQCPQASSDHSSQQFWSEKKTFVAIFEGKGTGTEVHSVLKLTSKQLEDGRVVADNVLDL